LRFAVIIFDLFVIDRDATVSESFTSLSNEVLSLVSAAEILHDGNAGITGPVNLKAIWQKSEWKNGNFNAKYFGLKVTTPFIQPAAEISYFSY
jgi:hypothetical protein